MADIVVKSLNYGNDAYKFQSEFNSNMLLITSTTTTTYPNAYVVIDGIPTSASSATKTITLLLSLRYKRYLLKINPLHSVTTNTNQCLEVIDLGTNGSLKLADVAYAFTSKTSNGTMSIYLKLYLNATYAHCDIEDISGNLDVPFTVEVVGNDNATYKETTIGAYFDELIAGQHNGAQGVIKTMQAQELENPLSIVGNARTTIESALSDLTGIANDVCLDAFSVTKTYQKGDFTIYENALYECITQHYGSWNASHFIQRYIAQEIQARPRFDINGTGFRLLRQDNPSSATNFDGMYEIRLGKNVSSFPANSWTNFTVTMPNGIFDWFNNFPDYDRLYIDVKYICAKKNYYGTGGGSVPILARINPNMLTANTFEVYAKPIGDDSATSGDLDIYFIAKIYATD